MGDPNTIPGLPVNADMNIAEPLGVVGTGLIHGCVENGTSCVTAKKHKLPDSFDASPSKMVKNSLGLPESLPSPSNFRSPPLLGENKTSTSPKPRTREEWSFINLDLGQDLLLGQELGSSPASPPGLGLSFDQIESPKSFENLGLATCGPSSSNLNNPLKDMKYNHELMSDGFNQGLERSLESTSGPTLGCLIATVECNPNSNFEGGTDRSSRPINVSNNQALPEKDIVTVDLTNLSSLTNLDSIEGNRPIDNQVNRYRLPEVIHNTYPEPPNEHFAVNNVWPRFPESTMKLDKYYRNNNIEPLERDRFAPERYLDLGVANFRNCNSEPRSHTVTSNAFNPPDLDLPYQPSEKDYFFRPIGQNSPKLPELKNHTITSSDCNIQDLVKTNRPMLEQPMKDRCLKLHQEDSMIDFHHLNPFASQSGLVNVHSSSSNQKITSGTNLPHQDQGNRPINKIETLGLRNIKNIDCSNISFNPNQQSHANEPINIEKHLFDQLLEMFPGIDKEFLATRCREGGDLMNIANSILEMNNNYPKDKTLFHKEYSAIPNIPIIETPNDVTGCDMKKSETGMNNQLEFLQALFPDAELSYLESKSKLQKNEITAFINEAVEKKDYPKIQLPTTQIKDENKDDECDLGLYTTSFDVEKFIKIFPDPGSYFLDEKRVCQNSLHGVEFLKRRYRYHKKSVIEQQYKLFKYNLTKTCEILDTLQPTMKNKRPITHCTISNQQNLLFLQEVCFIEHKAEIQEFFNNKAEARRIAYEEAEARNELIECSCCCYQVMFEDCATCDDGDLFCKECIKKHVEFRIGDAHVSFPCLSDCGSQFSLTLLQDLIDARAFSRLLQRIQLDEVKSANIEGLEICPFCEFATIPPPDTNIFTCLNTECLKESCRKCHKVSHIPLRCEEVENDDQARARKYIEDEMTKALVRECYKCKKSFIKMDGCNKMTCTCGAKMCYICREPITDYKHFNGPGGSQQNKCPLYSTEKVLHVDAVKAVGEQAKQLALQQNPELKLKHDPTSVLPSPTKAKTALPPGVEEDVNMLFAHMRRHYNIAVPFNDLLERLPVQPVIPAIQPHQPAVQPHQPAVQPHQPARQPHQPARQPHHPAIQLHQPAVQPHQPARQPHHPARQPHHPAIQLHQPAVQPHQPAVQPHQPARQPHQPARHVLQHVIPARRLIQVTNQAVQLANQIVVGRIPRPNLRPVGRPRHPDPHQPNRNP